MYTGIALAPKKRNQQSGVVETSLADMLTCLLCLALGLFAGLFREDARAGLNYIIMY